MSQRLGPVFWQQDRIVLAPMEGVVDSVMRDMLTQIGGIDLCVSEFIRVTDRLLPVSEFAKYAPELFSGFDSHTRAGTPFLVQLLGGQPAPMAENAAQAAQLGAAGIDLNFGCPAKTVNRHDGGATLLKDPTRIYNVISAVRKATPQNLTVSAKVRLGFQDKSLHREIAQAVESAGASWLTVHARTRDEGYRPPAHWEYIARMRESTSIPVIANGDIWNLADYHKCREVSGCRHVMLGRGLIATPSLARQIRQPQSQECASWNESVSLLFEFAEKSRLARHEHFAVCRVKQWLRSMARNSAAAEQVFTEIKIHETLAPILSSLQASNGSSLPA